MEQLLNFVELTKKFKDIERKIKFPDGSFENDAEHSFQLAIAAWYIASSEKLGLDIGKIFKYALAHDLVEVYAGDTPSAVHKSFEAERKTKHNREKEAAERLAREFPEFSELHAVIEAYEKREDEESRFVYALDKIMPILNIYLDGGYSWKALGVDIEDVIQYKKEQIAESPEIKKYFDMMVPKLRELKELR